MRTAPTREVHGVSVPAILYGTAWKEDATEALVAQALAAGYRGVDTANQRKHYFEEGVGRAVRAALEAGRVTRDELFLQTKFTFRAGQDHRLPYDPDAPVARQVAQSVESSLAHLGVARVDSLVLHGPSQHPGLGAADREAWRAMEREADAGRARLLGVSNVAPAQLEELLSLARIPPAFVQNRCYAERGWDARVRAVCRKAGVVYQGFSLLTANRHVVAHRAVGEVAARHSKTRAQVVLRFALALGMVPLTGTTDPTHMADDLALFDFELAEDELEALAGASR